MRHGQCHQDCIGWYRPAKMAFSLREFQLATADKVNCRLWICMHSRHSVAASQQLSSEMQEMVLPVEVLPQCLQRGSFFEKLGKSRSSSTFSTTGPPSCLNWRLPNRCKWTRTMWSAGTTSFVKFVLLTSSPFMFSSVSPSTRPWTHAGNREMCRVVPSTCDGCSAASSSTLEISLWKSSPDTTPLHVLQSSR